MMGCVVRASTIRGIEAVPVGVEIASSAGIPGIAMVGMPDGSVLEARSRVRCALRASGFQVPRLRFTINLSPAELRKTGTGLDLPIAVSILALTGQIPSEGLDGCLFVGELGLDGRVSCVRGMVAYERLAESLGLMLVCGPDEAGVSGRHGTRRIRMLSELRGGVRTLPRHEGPRTADWDEGSSGELDFSDVIDQEEAKRAIVISATGDHGLLMVGPPGSGKSMLAQRIPGILPPLGHEEAEQALLVTSVAGQDLTGILRGQRPFRAPHHSISTAGMIGGGRPVLPGEISLAHEGVLFLDELPEFAKNVLQSLRQPFEEREVRLVRADGVYRFPCRFVFVAASNPCPCGYLGDRDHACTCTPARIAQYQSRVGGPLNDRIGMHIFVARPASERIVSGEAGMTTAEMRNLVRTGREFAAWRREKWAAEEEGELAALRLDEEAQTMLTGMSNRLGLGGRAIVSVARVARTIADLEERERVSKADILESCAYRDRREG